nr:MAG TPA: hypothetical protein [Caudoviricetes sp.]
MLYSCVRVPHSISLLYCVIVSLNYVLIIHPLDILCQALFKIFFLFRCLCFLSL